MWLSTRTHRSYALTMRINLYLIMDSVVFDRINLRKCIILSFYFPSISFTNLTHHASSAEFMLYLSLALPALFIKSAL